MNDPLESALLVAWNASEPELPECHLCGNQRGPWVPDPSGDRWPSGAQKFLCKEGCAGAASEPPAVPEAVAEAAPKRRPAPLSVRTDPRLTADLATMARAGLNSSDAVRTALAIVADAYRYAWDRGAVPEGVQPVITACAILPYDSGSAGAPGA